MTTKIEWTEASWNPAHGCTPISPGCDNCYAARMAKRHDKAERMAKLERELATGNRLHAVLTDKYTSRSGENMRLKRELAEAREAIQFAEPRVAFHCGSDWDQWLEMPGFKAAKESGA